MFKRRGPPEIPTGDILETKIEALKKSMEQSFESIVNRSLVKSTDYIQRSSERGVANLVQPLMEEIKNYEKRIEKMVHDESLDREGMKQIINSVNSIHHAFSEDAKKFVISVRGNIHSLGRWGEETLENILIASGYVGDKDFLRQKDFTTLDGLNVTPDFIINLPQGRGLVIDSKLSLDSFMSYVEEKNEATKKQHAERLAENIRSHVSSLAKKKYHEIKEFTSMDYTVMFISSDPALFLSLSVDNNLIRDALKKNILIVGPTSMMGTLRSLEVLSRQHKQLENIKEITTVGKKIYERLGLFVERLGDAQDHLAKSTKMLNTAINHLSVGEHSLINEAQRLKDLGISSEKTFAIPTTVEKESK